MVLFLLILASTPLILLVSQGIIGRFLRLVGLPAQGQPVVILCFLAGYFPVGLVLWKVYLSGLAGESVSLATASVYAFVVYTVLGYAYFHVFNMSETARRVRIMREIYHSGRLAESELPSIYSIDAMLDNRMARLAALGQISVDGGRVRLKGRLLYNAARVISALATVLGYSPLSGPEAPGTPSPPSRPHRSDDVA